MTAAAGLPRVDILGVWLHNITRAAAIARMELMVESRRPHLVSTPNVDYIVQAQSDREFRTILNSTDLTLPDGMGVVVASRILRTPLLMNVGGRRTVPEMCRLAARRGFRVYLLGGRPGVAQRAADRLVREFQGLQIVGVQPGYFSADEGQKIVGAVRRSEADMLILALGTPRQEKWMWLHKHELDVPVTIGVGSTLDRLSGDVSSPPEWMTDVGLEWLYRTFQEPRRLGKRYLLEDPVFFWWILQQRLGLRRRNARQDQD